MLLDLRPGQLSVLPTDHRVDQRVDCLLPLSSFRCVWVLWFHALLRTGVGAFAQGTFPPPSPYSPLSSRVPRSAQHRAFPRRQPFCVRRRRCSWQRSKAFCCGLVPASYAPLRLLAPRRPELRSRGYPRLPLGGFRPRLVFPVARPFVCGGHPISTLPTVWTRPGLPGSPTPLPPVSSAHTVVRWGGPMRLRLHSAGATMPHLWPTGSSWGCLPSMTTRWFSASPSDPTSRWAPCPPESCERVASGPPWRCPAFACVPG
jgi:hypothetical protein